LDSISSTRYWTTKT